MDKQAHIPTLDGLRAVAILLVILSHAYQCAAAIGPMGVLIFFALSGYLITARLLDEYRKKGRISLRDFYLRRAFRILPPAVTYLTVVGLLSALGVVVCSWSAISGALLFYVNYLNVGAAGWRVGHFWSLSVEEHFYALWPCLLIVFSVRKGWLTAVVIALCVCAWRPTDNHFNFVAQAFNAPYLAADGARTDMIADALLWGCCLAFLPLRLKAVISTSIALSAAACLALLYLRDINHTTPLLHLLPTILLGAIVSCPAAPIGWILELAPMRFIGKLSYSLYIWQQLFLGGPGITLPLPIALAAAFVCAYLSYRFIEQPCIRFGRDVIRLGKNRLAANA